MYSITFRTCLYTHILMPWPTPPPSPLWCTFVCCQSGKMFYWHDTHNVDFGNESVYWTSVQRQLQNATKKWRDIRPKVWAEWLWRSMQDILQWHHWDLALGLSGNTQLQVDRLDLPADHPARPGHQPLLLLAVAAGVRAHHTERSDDSLLLLVLGLHTVTNKSKVQNSLMYLMIDL